MISEEKIRLYNKTLEPNLWDKNKNIKPEIRLDLLKIAQDFYTSTDFKTSFLDILLLGSSVNYTWTPESDIDVHIVIDITKEGLDPEHFRKFLDSLSGKFNIEHDIKIHGHKVEVYLQDITEKNSTPEKARKHGAIFSLLHNKWLVSPKFEKIILDKESIRKAFYDIKNKIDDVIENKNVEDLKTLMKLIRDYRNVGLEGEKGEFSTENIVFKALRHTGLLEKLKNAVNSIYDRMVSLEEMESYLNKLNNLDEGIVHELIEETINELNEKDKSYILIGAVDEQSRVTVMKVEKVNNFKYIQLYEIHKMLHYGEYSIDPNTALYWRYRSDINELIYHDYPSELQSISVKKYLINEYKIINSPKISMVFNENIDPKTPDDAIDLWGGRIMELQRILSNLNLRVDFSGGNLPPINVTNYPYYISDEDIFVNNGKFYIKSTNQAKPGEPRIFSKNTNKQLKINQLSNNNQNIVKEYIILYQKMREFMNRKGITGLYESKKEFNDIVAYHGTNKDFNELEPQKQNISHILPFGIHFSESPEVAKKYGKRVIETKLHFNNLYDATGKPDEIAKEVAGRRYREGMSAADCLDAVGLSRAPYGMHLAQFLLERYNYDGVKYRDKSGSLNYIVFKKDQIEYIQ